MRPGERAEMGACATLTPMGQETQPPAGDEPVPSGQDTTTTAAPVLAPAIGPEPEASGIPSTPAPAVPYLSFDLGPDLEPEWAKPSPGFVPMPDLGPFDEWFADDDGLGSLGPTPEDVAAEARRKADLRRRRTQALVREVVETGLLALLVFLAIRASFQKYVVDGSSMFPTLHNGQLLIVNQIIYSQVDTKGLGKFLPFLDTGGSGKKNVFHGPQRGDVIILVDPAQPSKDLVKRVIGLPGETIQIVSGTVYINDGRLDEPYIKTAWHADMAKQTIPADHYFVMGDNRDNSLDSRALGTIPANYVIGQAVLSFWPMDRFGLAPNESPTVTSEPPPTAGSVPAPAGH